MDTRGIERMTKTISFTTAIYRDNISIYNWEPHPPRSHFLFDLSSPCAACNMLESQLEKPRVSFMALCGGNAFMLYIG